MNNIKIAYRNSEKYQKEVFVESGVYIPSLEIITVNTDQISRFARESLWSKKTRPSIYYMHNHNVDFCLGVAFFSNGSIGYSLWDCGQKYKSPNEMLDRWIQDYDRQELLAQQKKTKHVEDLGRKVEEETNEKSKFNFWRNFRRS